MVKLSLTKSLKCQMILLQVYLKKSTFNHHMRGHKISLSMTTTCVNILASILLMVQVLGKFSIQITMVTDSLIAESKLLHYLNLQRSEEHTSELQSRENLVC